MNDDLLMITAEIRELCGMASHIAERLDMKWSVLESILGDNYDIIIEDMRLSLEEMECGARGVLMEAENILKM